MTDSITPRVCVRCGASLGPGQGTPPRWCSNACREAARRDRRRNEAAAILARLATTLGPAWESDLVRLRQLVGGVVSKDEGDVFSEQLGHLSS
jgi:predicted nucleic acid-binding Zn ribbon protein